jgi:hypothetical protein
MPIFMDRHDMRGLTAEDVAEAHRRDLEVQDNYGVNICVSPLTPAPY